MGNCCIRESATESVWASLDEIVPRKQTPMVRECGEIRLQDQVKIKITKRELEELIATARVHHVPVDRLFSRFINAAPRPPSWAPTLHTIAE